MTFEEFKAKYQKAPIEEYPNNVLAAIPNPVVSVTVSVYNHVHYIRECLDSILHQKTDFPFEVLIGDDQSVDGTREICIEYAKKYPNIIRLILHRRENNICIDGAPTGKFQSTYTRFLSRGRYYTVIDGDDYWLHTGKLQIQVAELECKPDLSMAAGVVVYLQQDVTMGEFFKSGLCKPDIVKPAYTFHEVVKSFSLHYSSFMFPTGLVNLPEWSLEVANGDEVLLALHADKGKIGFINVELSAYRLHEGGIWVGQDSSRQLSQAIKTFQMIDDHFEGRYSDTILLRHLSNLEFSIKSKSYLSGMRSATRLLEDGLDKVPDLRQYRNRLRMMVWLFEFKKFVDFLLIKFALRTRMKKGLQVFRKGGSR